MVEIFADIDSGDEIVNVITVFVQLTIRNTSLRVFGPKASQKEVYNHSVEPLMDHVITVFVQLTIRNTSSRECK